MTVVKASPPAAEMAETVVDDYPDWLGLIALDQGVFLRTGSFRSRPTRELSYAADDFDLNATESRLQRLPQIGKAIFQIAEDLPSVI